MTPQVSVVMPVYNTERYVAQAVESILRQTFTDFEFIIVDDGSTDGTPQILASYDDPRIVVHRVEPNGGLVNALNTGWRMARGELIAIMHADDVSLPDRLAKQVDYLQQHLDVGVLGTRLQLMDQLGQLGGMAEMHTNPDHLAWEILFACPLAHPSVMIRKQLLLITGGYRSEMATTEDYDLWARISHHAKLANLEQICLNYRVWSGSITSNNAIRMEKQSIQVIHELLNAHSDMPVSLKIAAILRRLNGAGVGQEPENAAEVREVDALLMRLYAQSARTPAIRHSAAVKRLVLAKLALRLDVGLGLRLLWKAIRLQPRALVHAIKVTLKRQRS